MRPIVVSSYRRIVVSSYRRRTVLLRPHCRADRDWLLIFFELFALEPIADFSKTKIQNPVCQGVYTRARGRVVLRSPQAPVPVRPAKTAVN